MDQFLTYEALKNNNENGCYKQGHIIAWVIGIALALIVIAIFWQGNKRSMDRANERLTDYALRSNERLGLLEGNQVVIGDIVRTNSSNINGLTKVTSANSVEVDALGNIVDKLAVITANTGGCGGNGGDRFGIPRYRKTNTYQICDSRLVENDACGQA